MNPAFSSTSTSLSRHRVVSHFCGRHFRLTHARHLASPNAARTGEHLPNNTFFAITALDSPRSPVWSRLRSLPAARSRAFSFSCLDVRLSPRHDYTIRSDIHRTSHISFVGFTMIPLPGSRKRRWAKRSAPRMRQQWFAWLSTGVSGSWGRKCPFCREGAGGTYAASLGLMVTPFSARGLGEGEIWRPGGFPLRKEQKEKEKKGESLDSVS